MGGTKFKAGKYVKDDAASSRRRQVKSGATVKVVNKGTKPAPHTISFVEKEFLPEELRVRGRRPAPGGAQVNEETEERRP